MLSLRGTKQSPTQAIEGDCHATFAMTKIAAVGRLVYELYGLTEDEIRIVEGN